MEKNKKIILNLFSDPVLMLAAIAAIISAIFVPPSKKYLEYIDLRVICLLLCIMLVVSGLQKVGVFGYIIEFLLKKVHNTRILAFVLINACFFSSMLITNDVSLITFVPLGIMMMMRTHKQILFIPIIVLQTLAANLGSMFTPFGNPQNLYLFSISNMTVWKFLSIMIIPSVVSFFLLSVAVCLIKSEPIDPVKDQTEILKIAKILPWVLLFALCMLTVFHVIPYGIALAAVVLGILILDKTILLCADYSLLLTFVFLFIFIGNIKNIPAVSTSLSALVAGREITVGILLSQVISNVPAAMLMSKFTENYYALLLGVNLGGLGTLVASMASVISYKLYAATYDSNKGKYLVVFTISNILFLIILWLTITIFFK